ncbi:MAG TPA: imidazole glycerol phosphate synthase subunit HisH [Bacteroidota bacterium]|nr:imidazole glycerol phosphate synthase subunit HisH [Bacteroidota bacterium]
MIGIIDYRLNNLRSVQKAFEKVGASAFISSDPKDLARADKLVLPGVGAFGAAMGNIATLGLEPTIRRHVESGRPLIGICLGMQLLFSRSCELGLFDGLDFIKGEVKLFPGSVKIPHIGWNQVELRGASPLMKSVEEKSFVYFVHSYYAEPKEPVTIATTEYGFHFTSAVQKSNVFGIQFHPEKSQKAGLQMLKNFAEMQQP